MPWVSIAYASVAELIGAALRFPKIAATTMSLGKKIYNDVSFESETQT